MSEELDPGKLAGLGEGDITVPTVPEANNDGEAAANPVGKAFVLVVQNARGWWWVLVAKNGRPVAMIPQPKANISDLKQALAAFQATALSELPILQHATTRSG